MQIKGQLQLLKSLNGDLRIDFSSGAIIGLVAVALALLNLGV
ncbi:hypothetical protein [Clostridium perfringens]